MTPAQFQAAVDDAVAAADAVLPMLGQPELVPLVNGVAMLVKKIAAAVAGKGDDASVAIVMDAARVAADAAEALKFPYDPVKP